MKNNRRSSLAGNGPSYGNGKWRPPFFLYPSQSLYPSPWCLSHPSYYDVVRAPKAFYLIMEYGSGGDLATLLAKRANRLQPLSEDHSLTWLRQLLDATAYLHRRNLIHR